MKTAGQLQNSDIKDYYDKHVGGLEEGYTHARWFSSEAARFDYEQTRFAIEKALEKQVYDRVVEIGPGDAVWTPLLLPRIQQQLHLVEQSEEMLALAKEKLVNEARVAFELSDFESSNPPQDNNLVFAIRCFEYFANKEAAVRKMASLLTEGGTLILLTKNASLYTGKNVQHQAMHSDQLTAHEITTLLSHNGFKVDAYYPAVLRWKIKYWIPRQLFNGLHWLGVVTRGRFYIPGLFDRAAESIVYIAHKK